MTSQIWNNDTTKQLATTLVQLDSVGIVQSFLSDVMTEKEIIEISARLEAAKMLRAGEKYTAIVAATGLSTRTVARISTWLKTGTGGYDAALVLIDAHHAHLSPAHAE